MADPTSAAQQQLPFLSGPTFYFNGYQMGLSNTDITIVSMLDNQPNARMTISYSIAKSLSNDLAAAIKTVEAATGVDVMTNVEVGERLARHGISTAKK